MYNENESKDYISNMNLKTLDAYELKIEKDISDLNSKGALLEHKKSGAKIVCLSNDDNNKVFYIGFRTTPTNSTGVAHIMEHTVLCGSRKFPVKDPFVELVKGSLNTFLNAMTYPDKTVYPVASCNDKDFHNLMDVYLDAVFYPNIFKEKKIFMQEGWHYELDSKEAELTYNGVVYNEMKGAFSSPDDVLDRAILNTLFPDNTYANESGGDPDVIPELTYEEYLDFHKKYYHPSNSYIFLYGDMDMEEKLRWLDQEYLSVFDRIDVDSTIARQAAFDEIADVQMEYSITAEESEEQNTYLSYNTVVSDALDQEKYMAFQILDYAICSSPGAPIKRALTKKGIGTEIYSTYDNGVYQPYFSIVAKNADLDQKADFIATIEEELRAISQNGVDKNSLKAGLNYFEFKYREADFGQYPKGLIYGLQMLDSWLYDETTPFMHVEESAIFALLKERIDTDYFDRLIDDYLLQNPHKAYVTVVPKKGLNTEKEAALAAKLQSFKERLSPAEIDALVEQTKALKEYQESEDDPCDIVKIPMLRREDMKKEAEPYDNELVAANNVDILFHDIFTNGVSYSRLVFNASHVNQDELFALGVMKLVWGLMDTKHYSYGDFFNEIFMKTGGISPLVATFGDAIDDDKYSIHVEAKAKSLYGKTEDAFKLMEELFLYTDFSDKDRLLEILKESKSRKEARMMSASHALAQQRASSYFNPISYIEEQLSGVDFYENLCDLIANYDKKADALIAQMNALTRKIFRKDRFMVDYTGTREGLEEIKPFANEVYAHLFDDATTEPAIAVTPVHKNEGFKSAGAVNYVGVCGNFKKAGLPYHGALSVVRVMMGYEYLWLNVRVKGGAYGCMNGFSKGGDCYFVSYRDPNLKDTLEIYKGASDFIKHYEADERTMTKYIIGAISDKDTPLTPQTRGARSMGAYFSHYDFEMEQKERDEILQATPETIRGLSKYIDAILLDNHVCVVGTEESIKDAKDLFYETKNLILN